MFKLHGLNPSSTQLGAQLPQKSSYDVNAERLEILLYSHGKGLWNGSDPLEGTLAREELIWKSLVQKEAYVNPSVCYPSTCVAYSLS